MKHIVRNGSVKFNTVSQVDPIDKNISLAQGDETQNTSFGLSTLNITLVSWQKPAECREKCTEKFVSQKSKLKNTNTRVQKKHAVETPVW